MADKPTQYTPKGLEIPVPSRKQVEDDLAKVAEPMVGSPDHPSSPKRKRSKRK
jgi:hypothetical protein